jgi:hypothetical protein
MTICNSLHIFTPMNAIEQVTKNATHRIYNHILVQLIATQLQLSQQLLFNYYATPL